MLSPQLTWLLGILIILAWFFMGGKRSVGEKFGLLFILLIGYVGFRLITGATVAEILEPLRYLPIFSN